jgi:hypothetical protein
MSRRSGGNELALLPKPPLLITESADEFDAVYEALERDIKPRGIVEQMYVADIAYIVWETVRLRRCKAAIINTAFHDALKGILEQVLDPLQRFHDDESDVAEDEAKDEQGEATNDEEGAADDEANDEKGAADDEIEDYNYDPERLATGWFTYPEAKERVSEIFGQFQLDESAIEAEAIRQSFSDLELLDKMLAQLESRRNKALRCIGEYRESLARQLRESADRIIEGKDLLQLEHPSSKKSAA